MRSFASRDRKNRGCAGAVGLSRAVSLSPRHGGVGLRPIAPPPSSPPAPAAPCSLKLAGESGSGL